MARFLALSLVFVLGACSGGGIGRPPANLNNACSILDQRPGYLRAFRSAHQRWGTPVHIQMALIYQESKFVSNARTPVRYRLGIIPAGRMSSAFGYAQALDGTWGDFKRATGRWRARRDRIHDAADFIGWYTNRTASRNGVHLHDVYHQYLAYHEGHTGFARGAYKRKRWLRQIAVQVENRAALYKRQLRACS